MPDDVQSPIPLAANRHSCHRLAVIQPAILQYSVPLFTRLIAAAQRQGIHIDVFEGTTPSAIRARQDSGDAGFARSLRTHEWMVGRKSLFYKSPVPVWRGGYDLVILEQAVRNIETYELLVRMGRSRIAFMGHGRTYTTDASPPQEALKHWLTQRGTWFFGYTDRGVDAVVERGFPRDRTTVLNNTIDTATLQANLGAISDADIGDFARRHDLRGKTALYLGGLDTAKRIPFLLDAAVVAHQNCSDFRLLIAGNGSDRSIVDEFVARNSWAIYLGTVHGRDKARALKSAQAISIPGTIGLAAVDSMVSGTPIVTTDHPYHAPEFEYLVDSAVAVVTRNDLCAYGEGLASFLTNRIQQQEMSERCQIESAKYPLDEMIRRFLTGIGSALGSANCSV